VVQETLQQQLNVENVEAKICVGRKESL